MSIQTAELISDRASLLLGTAFKFKLTGSEFKVYYCLVQFWDCNQRITESVEKMASECDLDRKTVMRVLDSLIDRGMVRRLEPKTRSYIYELTSPLDWVERPPVDMSQKGTVPKLDVPKLDNELQQQDSCTSPKGTSAESVVADEEKTNMSQKRTVPEIDITSLEPKTDLDSKIAAARKLGCNVGICWNREEMFVRLDGALKTVSEFVAMPLEVFKQSVQLSQSGLDLCRSQIEKIKERLKNQRLTRLEQLATSG